MIAKGINPDFAPIVEYVIEHGKITNSGVRIILGLGKRAVSRILVDLQHHFLIQVGMVGKGTYYIAKWDTNGTKH